MSLSQGHQGLRSCTASSPKVLFPCVPRSRHPKTAMQTSVREHVGTTGDKNMNVAAMECTTNTTDGDLIYSTAGEDIIFGADVRPDSISLHEELNYEDLVAVSGGIRVLTSDHSSSAGRNTTAEYGARDSVPFSMESVAGRIDFAERHLYGLFDMSGIDEEGESRDILELMPGSRQQIRRIIVQNLHPRLQELQGMLRRSLLAVCRSYGLPLRGTKKELVERIWNHEQTKATISPHKQSAVEVPNGL